jgi:hypothetical protein
MFCYMRDWNDFLEVVRSWLAGLLATSQKWLAESYKDFREGLALS